MRGRIEENIAFVITLPSHDVWKSKVLMTGGGGFLGSLPSSGAARDDLLNRGYAYGGSNLGHYSRAGEADWAWDPTSETFNDKLQIDFGYRATHLTNILFRQLAESYYDSPVERMYWESCSMGGRVGVVSAQRYPDDFDGIIAGAPGLAWTQSMLTWIAIQKAMFPDPDDLSKPVLPAEKLRDTAKRDSTEVRWR